MRARLGSDLLDEPTLAMPVMAVAIDLAALQAPSPLRDDRLRFVMCTLLSLSLHAALLAFPETQQKAAQVEEAIPVEIIIEPSSEPPAPQPAPSDEIPENLPVNIEEAPATDYARTADQDREDGAASETPTAEAETARTETSEIKPEPKETAETEVAPTSTAEPDAPAPDPAPIELPPSPGPDPTPQPLPTTPSQTANLVPRFVSYKPLPEFQFKPQPELHFKPMPEIRVNAPAARRTNLPNGAADPGYLSTLYGLIMRQMSALPNNTRPIHGRVTFAVLANGSMAQETVAIASGAPSLDFAALSAVRRAAPFPAPPHGPVHIRFDYGAK